MKFMKRDELAKSVTKKMQSWYEIRVEGRETVCKYVFFFFFASPESSPLLSFYYYLQLTSHRKGPLKPIQVTVKTRQGRKACTLIMGFELFLVVEAEEMAEELRRVCAGATSGSCFHFHSHSLPPCPPLWHEDG